MQLIGIMGGTFNPIHIGHLIIANEVLHSLKLEKILFIPTGQPPHKEMKEVAPAIDRFNMVKYSIRGNDKFEVLDLEVKREGKTYTIDTLKELKELYKDAHFYFIIGFDTLRELSTWKDIDKIYEYCRFVVVNRDSDLNEINQFIIKYKEIYRLDIKYVNIPNIGISSTLIRNRIRENKTIKYMVTEYVENYIRENNLYRG
ncbi:nicotinate-nucleotide adenylyltransferase [Thermobrachium celere]|uniref:Probable nicotinate-nucleotide adenylyltransferase n=1 Tax=Thermobrachium celere DSM 8682 TaxID=941824 RepID=R7RS52_9CLOT|nr:nicotinate-nucleotide adenylyltransferase [Thermobrachium celere]CDF58108.1 Nicotinate-nucleotide adenylyltransferase [Thermobrachium celere DSM 8682]